MNKFISRKFVMVSGVVAAIMQSDAAPDVKSVAAGVTAAIWIIVQGFLDHKELDGLKATVRQVVEGIEEGLADKKD